MTFLRVKPRSSLVKAGAEEVKTVRKPGAGSSRLGVVADGANTLNKFFVQDLDLHILVGKNQPEFVLPHTCILTTSHKL